MVAAALAVRWVVVLAVLAGDPGQQSRERREHLARRVQGMPRAMVVGKVREVREALAVREARGVLVVVVPY